MSSGSDDELASGSSASDYSSDGEEPVPSAPAPKKRRVEGAAESLGLELLQPGGALRSGGGGAAGAALAAADIDGSQEAEASLLHLEVEELLKEARPDPALESALLRLLHQLAALLRALPQAEVAPADSAAISGFLSDLAFNPVVSSCAAV